MYYLPRYEWERGEFFAYIKDPDRLIEEDVMEAYHQILRTDMAFRVRSVFEFAVVEFRNRAQPLNPDREHVQIIIRDNPGLGDNPYEPFRNGHWACIHYRRNTLRVYDSNYNDLTKNQRMYLGRLWPALRDEDITFPMCQKQNNSVDCGLFALAYATSLVLGDDPSELLYVVEQMRPHAFEMVKLRRLTRFPSIMHDHKMVEMMAEAREQGKALRPPREEFTYDHWVIPQPTTELPSEEEDDIYMGVDDVVAQRPKRKPQKSVSEPSVSKKPCKAPDLLRAVPEAMKIEEERQQQDGCGMRCIRRLFYIGSRCLTHGYRIITCDLKPYLCNFDQVYSDNSDDIFWRDPDLLFR